VPNPTIVNVMTDTDFSRVADAIAYLTEHAAEQPRLEAVASRVGLSAFHFQRTFRRYAGVTPKQFLAALTVESAKTLLDRDASVLETAFDLGLSGPARLHDHFVTLEGITPGEYKAAGDGLRIEYGVAGTPFGSIFVAQTPRGIAALSFVADAGERALSDLRNMWPHAHYTCEHDRAAEIAGRMFDQVRNAAPLRVLGVGTNFQVRVWRALLEIPFGLIGLAHRTGDQRVAIAESPRVARCLDLICDGVSADGRTTAKGLAAVALRPEPSGHRDEAQGRIHPDRHVWQRYVTENVQRDDPWIDNDWRAGRSGRTPRTRTRQLHISLPVYRYPDNALEVTVYIECLGSSSRMLVHADCEPTVRALAGNPNVQAREVVHGSVWRLVIGFAGSVVPSSAGA